MKRNGKRHDVKIEFTARYLSECEADQVRQAVIELKPKTYLVLPNWRWLEARGLAETKAKQLIETLKAMWLRFRIEN